MVKQGRKEFFRSLLFEFFSLEAGSWERKCKIQVKST